jgi:hypothetical protein
MPRFPSIKARDLEGRDVSLPDELPQTPRVVILAFKRWHTELIESWEPVLEALESRCRQLSVWEVPALSRVYLPVRGFIDGGMRSGITEPEARQHTLTAYTDLSALARELGLPSLDTIYVLLLAPDGTIVWRGQGPADAEQTAAMRQAVEELACG